MEEPVVVEPVVAIRDDNPTVEQGRVPQKEPPRGQYKGKIVPGPTAYVECPVCTMGAQILAGEGKKVNPIGWLKRDLLRHLVQFHGVKMEAGQ